MKSDSNIQQKKTPPALVDSPCNGDCIIDQDTGYCEGCGRTMTEIRKWLTYTDQERQAVYCQLEPRKAGLVGPADDDY